MFETKILTNPDWDPNSAHDSLEQLSALESGTLRAFDWPELVARIAATNDLRRVVNSSASGFGAFAALAGGSLPDELPGKGKHAVNLNALGAGKDPSSIAVVDEHPTLGDRKQA